MATIQKRVIQTRLRLLEAAVGLFMEYGYDGVTMDQIAIQADVARSTLFNHYPEKLDLLRAFYLDFVQQVSSEAARRPDPAWNARLRSLCLAFGARSHRFKPIVQAIASLAMGHGPLAQAESEVDQILSADFRAIVSAGQAQGGLRTDRSAEELGDLLLALLTVTAHDWVNAGMTADLGHDLIARMDLVVSGLSPR